MPWLLYNQGASKRVSWLFVQHYKVAKYEYTLHCQQFLACCNSILRKLQVTKTELKKTPLYCKRALLYEPVKDISDDPHIVPQITYKMISIKDVSKFPAENI
jgi:hypothetical protein